MKVNRSSEPRSHPVLECAGPKAAPVQVTLLETVWALQEVARDDREVVATVLHWMDSGRIALCGNFKGHRFQVDPEP